MSFEFKVLKILLQFGATRIKFRISSAKRRMRKKSTHKHTFIFPALLKSEFVSWLGNAKLLLSITYISLFHDISHGHGGAVLHISETHISTYIAADMSSALRTKVFEGHIMPQVQRWIADNPLRRHDQTLDFHRWWQIIMGYPLADASTRETEPDYRIVEEAGGRRVLKHSGFNSRVFVFTTYMWTIQEHASMKSYIETVA